MTPNKADGELKKSAEITQREYKNALSITNRSRIGEDIGVVIFIIKSEYFENVWKNILNFINHRKKIKIF